MLKLADRTNNLPNNFFAQIERRVAQLQSERADVIRLDIGSPDLPPHPDVINCLKDSVSNPGNHGYQTHLGPPPLRSAWSNHYLKCFDVSLDPDTEILPLLGSKEGIFHLSMALLNPGDKALIPDPGYMTYTRGSLFAGAVPTYFTLRATKEFLPEWESIDSESLKNARILWLNYPNNPTGATVELSHYKEAVDFAINNKLILVSDCAYTQVTYDDYRAPSIFEIPGAKEVAVEFNSLSKSHNMPGWRSGAVAGNSHIIKALFKIKTNIDSGGFRPVLDASTTALNVDTTWIKERNAIYQHRRDLVLQALSKVGISASKPKAAIYIWAAVPSNSTDLDFVNAVLEQTHVSLTPGSVFGSGGKGFFRIALTTPTDRLEEAMNRLSKI